MNVFRSGHSHFTLILGVGLRTQGADRELESLTFLQRVPYIVVCECLSGCSCSTLIKEAQGADSELESLTYLLLSDLVMQIEYSLVLRLDTAASR